jgi:WD40 repeat protein
MDFGAAAELDAVQTSAAVGDGVLRAGCWDPHHQHQFVSVNDRVVRGWDLRTMQVTHVLQNAHSEPILDVDFNPNRPYHFLTCGEDLLARFWDLRKLDRPLKLLGKHSHWITQARFNQSHDQLVLTAGTDGSVLLWSVVSMSSAPLGDLEDPQNEKDGDKLIKTYDEHEDSVYSVAWSAGDAWVFASLSYDGRLVVNHVPPAEKYKILL